MRHMPLRHKMTLLYSVFTGLIFCALLSALYFTVSGTLTHNQSDLLRLSYAQLTALIEMEHGEFTVEHELQLPRNAAYQITDGEGNLLAQYRMPPGVAEHPFENGNMRQVHADGETWLLLDGEQQQDALDVYIRICLSMEDIGRTLGVIQTASLIAGPALLIIAALLGLAMARRSLAPIDRIIASANIVAKGDLSERIQGSPASDEVGALTRTVNNMLDKLEAAFRREKRFASDASHELRTPVSVILAYAELLAQEVPPGGDAEKSVQTILVETGRMRRIIEQLLMLTRGEDGKYALTAETVDMAEVLQMVTEQLESMARARGITVTLDVENGAHVRGDQSLITQMMLNLLENALKYGKEDGHVRLSAAETQGTCSITVADDGPGIAESDLPHIFERFFRADSARDRSGSGLGLSIVEWIVAVHHGTIKVRSTPEDGTVFTVTLP